MDKIDTTKVVKLSERWKRVLQYKALKDWSTHKITGVTCIETILEYEKLIFVNKDILEECKHETE